jgi:hypothetical protein
VRALNAGPRRALAALGLRVIAELVAKGDPHWTRFKKANV